jgi:uncharacterized protein (TIGR02118 family)
MYRLTVVYENVDKGKFDFDYYINKHLPLVKSRIGDSITRTVVCEGIKGVSNEKEPYKAVVQVYLKNLEGLERGLETHGEEIMSDIPRFTNIDPVLNLEKVVDITEF